MKNDMGRILDLFILLILASTPCTALVHSSRLFSSSTPSNHLQDGSSDASFDDAVRMRYACKKFKRSDGSESSVDSASKSDPQIVKKALQCLEIARLAPSSFNTQPYKIILVHSEEQKMALSKCALGPNGDRIRDSDCTAVFLADKQTCRNFKQFEDLVLSSSTQENKPSQKQLNVMKFYITMFSSGLPLPRILAATISFMIRTAISIVNLFTSRFYPMPSLSSAETWTSKQVTMVAMIYMLACSSRGIATIPMEGINARSIRKVLGVPSRYAIPVVIATGMPYRKTEMPTVNERLTTKRYSTQEVIYGDSFGTGLQIAQ